MDSDVRQAADSPVVCESSYEYDPSPARDPSPAYDPSSAYDQLSMLYGRYQAARMPAVTSGAKADVDVEPVQDEASATNESACYLDKLFHSFFHAKAYGGSGGRTAGGGAYVVADLGCGSGQMLIALARMGYRCYGVDCSAGMLSEAQWNIDRAEPLQGLWEAPLLIQQDVTRLNLGCRVDLCLALTDTINHMLDEEELRGLFRSVKRHLKNGGLFIFDFLTAAHYRNIRGEQFVVDQDYALSWSSHFDEGTQEQLASISGFVRQSTGLYRRFDTEVRERLWSIDQLEEMAKENGLASCGFFAANEMNPIDGEAAEREERLFALVRKLAV